MDPAQLDGVADSILAGQLVLATGQATSSDDFRARVEAAGVIAARTDWVGSLGDIPPGGFVLTEGGTAYCLGSGNTNVGQLLGSFVFSDPLDDNEPPCLVFADAGLQASRIQRILQANTNYAGVNRVIFSGHSLGGAAVAIVLASEIYEGRIPPSPELITFGAPKPGDRHLASYIAAVPTIRWQNQYDPVPLIPFSVGLFTQLIFSFPISTAIGFTVGYKQLQGGRLLHGATNSWQVSNEDYGIFNALGLVGWLVQGEFSWISAHSLTTYLTLLSAVQGANAPNGLSGPLVSASGSNKVAAPPITRAFLVRIFGQLAGQGWSFNYFCGSTDYGQCITHGTAIATAMIGMMTDQASILAVTASDPTIVGDSQDSPVGLTGQLATGSNVAAAPPNLACLWQLKVANNHRREMWVHGLTNQIKKSGASNQFIYTGSAGAAKGIFEVQMLNGLAGLIPTPPGLYLRTLITGGNKLGGVLGIAANVAGQAVLTLDTMLPGIPPPPGTLVTLKGRTPLSTLRGTWPIFSTTPPNQVTLSTPFPQFFVYTGKGASLYLQAYNYQQPDSMTFDGIFTHKTGRPYGLRRGRAPRHR